MPTEIQTPFAWARLADKFRLTGRHKLMLDEVVVPVVLVEDLSEPGIINEQDATCVMVIAAPVGVAKALLENPAGSGVRFLLDRIVVSGGMNMIPAIQLTQTAPTNPIAGALANVSWNNPEQSGSPPGTMFADDGVFVGESRYNNNLLALTSAIILPKLVLPAGWLIVINTSTAARDIRVVINYRVQSFDVQ